MGSKFNEDELNILINSINKNQGTPEENIQKLRRIRCGLLDEIHKKQQLLDKVDYIICKLRKGDKQ